MRYELNKKTNLGITSRRPSSNSSNAVLADISDLKPDQVILKKLEELKLN